MNRAAWKRLKNEQGASLVAAILFFVLCGVGASVILAAASASAGKMEQVPDADQKRFAVESAAAFLRDELRSTENIIKIKEIMVEDSSEPDEVDDEVTYFYVGSSKKTGQESSWQPFGEEKESVLDSFIQELYVPMDDAAQHDSGTSEEKTFTLSVQTPGSAESQNMQKLQAKVQLSMSSDYQITAVISDMETDEEHEEERCRRKLTVPAQVLTETDVVVENFTETDEDGNVTDEWSITTTTRLTTIWWERGKIEWMLSENE